MTTAHQQAGLTRPQWELLCEIHDGERSYTVDEYKPAVGLESAGLICKLGPGWANRLIATDAGKELVAKVRAAIGETK